MGRRVQVEGVGEVRWDMEVEAGGGGWRWRLGVEGGGGRWGWRREIEEGDGGSGCRSDWWGGGHALVGSGVISV